jgi:hypothetical protein
MKYLLPIILFLASCTSPEFVTLKTKDGEHIHTVSENAFFNTPDKASEWAFWYFPVVVFAIWLVWKEFKTIKFPKNKSADSSTEDQNNNEYEDDNQPDPKPTVATVQPPSATVNNPPAQQEVSKDNA